MFNKVLRSVVLVFLFSLCPELVMAQCCGWTAFTMGTMVLHSQCVSAGSHASGTTPVVTYCVDENGSWIFPMHGSISSGSDCIDKGGGVFEPCSEMAGFDYEQSPRGSLSGHDLIIRKYEWGYTGSGWCAEEAEYEIFRFCSCFACPEPPDPDPPDPDPPTSDPCDGDGTGGTSSSKDGCPKDPMSRPPGSTPIVVDIDRGGFRFTNLENGVYFDIDADGQLDWISWTDESSDDAFLVLDRNSNGQIDNGAELFGNITDQPPSDDLNGYAALAVFDEPENGGDGDRLISVEDQVYTELLLWVDSNHNALSEPEELHGLDELGISMLDLEYTESNRTDRHGNWLRLKSFAYPETGGRTHTIDVHFLSEDSSS